MLSENLNNFETMCPRICFLIKIFYLKRIEVAQMKVQIPRIADVIKIKVWGVEENRILQFVTIWFRLCADM